MKKNRSVHASGQRRRRSLLTVVGGVCAAAGVLACAGVEPAPPELAWDSPSTDARGSMPLGNGDVALNAWVEPSGDLLFYVAKSDAWEDNARLAKVGLVRVRLTPALLAPGATFEQRLVPARGEMVVTATPPRRAGQPAPASVTLRLWVDANHPTAWVEVQSDTPVGATAAFELWRTAPATLPTIEVSDLNLEWSKPDHQHAPTVVEPDTVLRDLPDGIGWFHRNQKSNGPEESMRHQDLLGAPWHDPILHRIFGAVIRSPGAQRVDDQRLARAPATQHLFAVHVLAQQPATPAEWLARMRALVARVEGVDPAERRTAHLAWWREFWARSHIVASPRTGPRIRRRPST